MRPFRQAIWGHIWRCIMGKSDQCIFWFKKFEKDTVGKSKYGMLTLFLVCWPYFWYVDHISGMLTIFLVCWLYFLYVDLISGRLTISIWRISIAYFVLSQVYFVATLSFWKWGFFQILLKSLQILEILSGACLSFWIFDKADTMAKNDNWDQPTGIQGQTAL